MQVKKKCLSPKRNNSEICLSQKNRNRQMKKRLLKALFFFLLINSSLLLAQKWSFSFVADPRAGINDFQRALTEIKSLSLNPEPKMSNSDFVIVGGDFDPAEIDYKIFNEVFPQNIKPSPKFFPVMGNHDLDYTFFIKEKILGKQQLFKLNDSASFSYYVDWKNCRLIIIDQYKGLGTKNGCISENGIRWVEDLIKSSNSPHVFIAFHEPAFPRYRHIGNSFDACIKERDEFWNMLLKYKEKVRAVLVGHTHFYYAMKIKDVKGDAADKDKFPVEEGGIYQIDGGAAGNSEDGSVTAVEFMIDNESVIARVIQSKKGEKDFQIIETIKIN
jgi:hypothetical protein